MPPFPPPFPDQIPTLYTDTGAPTTLSWTVTQAQSGLDLTTVTGCVFTVTSPTGAQTTWTGTIQSGATSTQCTLLYAFQGGELATPGMYVLRAAVTVPGGSENLKPTKQLRSVTPGTFPI